MGKSIIAALACLPFAAQAEKLLVEYEGTVSSIERASLADAPPYSIGDAIGGTLIIDTELAPADRRADDANVGRYYGGSPSLDFILGAKHPAENGSGDLVIVYDDWQATDESPADGFFINDRSIGTDGELNLVLGMLRPNSLGQLFANDALAQSFTVDDEPGTTLWGYVERGFGEFWRIVSFTLDRFSVTPGVCRASSASRDAA
jgi:hypothetical protein